MNTFWAIVVLVLCWLFVTCNDAHAVMSTPVVKRVLVLLDTSSQPATMAECRRAGRGLPVATISYQQRTNEPWHHRTCIFQVTTGG